ncbi:ATP-binding cassette domain-containing protein [Kribbella albertanoniae]|uniref:ATP-binding cassette domain-containing protein n=1 Tax=Kribbella albertanoniae TaxID=1266829 RepID=A0A4R4QC25_9ACTN|nr:ATP-binding cassette domain-containing protein [Kribbella albertanoniae]TDC32689.1 ATP-binding cassette domain-containing protein [Kribbella albertanoniae]
MIEVEQLSKRYGDTLALSSVDLSVAAGQVLGLIGHNGAGKTTLVEILSTLVRPSAGTARVAGADVVGSPGRVRRSIGLTGQFATVDDTLSGTGNLVLLARLSGTGRRAARVRAAELLEQFGLTQAADRRVRTYSGGMRRRLDLAASLVTAPAVLFLDEPTTGLDPTSRRAVWEQVAQLAERGTTILLTTQYLEEADQLSDRIVVLAGGRVVAGGTPADLKQQVGRRAIVVRLPPGAPVGRVIEHLAGRGLDVAQRNESAELTVVDASSATIVQVVRALDDLGIEAERLEVAEPSLDDVFATLGEAR